MNLLPLSQGLRAGAAVFRSGVYLLAQGADRDRRDITFVDGRCDGPRLRPAQDIARTHLWRPPDPGIGSERWEWGFLTPIPPKYRVTLR